MKGNGAKYDYCLSMHHSSHNLREMSLLAQ